MGGQLHAGQLRYHDFHLLRKQSKSIYTSSTQRFLNNIPMIRISIPPKATFEHPQKLQQLQLQQQQQRTFVTETLNKYLKLKPLEKQANENPNDPNIQGAFLMELSDRYPEAVIERFENHSNFIVTDHIAYMYLQAIKKTSTPFHMKRFLQRLQSGQFNLEMSSHTLVQLENILNHTHTPTPTHTNKHTHTHTHTHDQFNDNETKISIASGAQGQLLAAMDILRTSMRTAMTGIGGTSAAAFASGQHGTNSKNPLYVALNTPTTFREQVFKTVRLGVVLFFFVSAAGALLDGRGMSRPLFGGKHIQESEGSDIRFDDVKGVEEAKSDLEEIVLYLKDPDRFTRLGGKLPRGLLLTGPPGTGKTLLAKAIAGEAGVPFFFSSGSQFEEVYVGLGAKRVRELFEAAKKKAPAIIFIDEIDAVGGSRKLKDQSAMKMTLNELLVQMDGFDENNGIIVVGATNFAESLDSALLRPGRFDKHVVVPLPDVGGRREILEMYAKKTKLGKDVDLDVLARGTVGFSGADIYNLMNQAALKASVDGLNSITMEVFEYAKDKIMMGAERKTAVITAKTARCTAFHEAGHALVAALTEGALPIHKATIMPRGQALGMVTMLPEGDQTSQSYKEMLAFMDVCMGGRVAEELVFGKDNITSGASSDILNATKTARAMVTKFGFSNEVGIVYHGGGTGEESASGKTRASIDEEVKRLTDQAYKRATDLLKKYKTQHYLLAETLLEYESLTGDEVRDIIHKGKKPNRPIINKHGGAKGDQSIFQKDERMIGVGGKVGARRERR